MTNPPFQLNEDQMQALRQIQAQQERRGAQSQLLDSEALKANRAGQITAQQRRELISRASNFGMVGLLLWLILLAGIIVATGRFLANNPLIGIVALFGTLFVAQWVVGRIYSIPMRLRLARPRIEQMPGEVIWHGSSYVAEASGRLLRPIYSGSRMLKPGLYTFFCLGGTPWLIAAEMTGTHGAARAAQAGAAPRFDIVEVSRALALANGFTAADLQRNRQGRLSRRQARGQLSDIFSNLYGIATILVIAVLAVVGFSNKAKLDINAVLVVFLFLGFAFLLFFVHAFRDFLDILGGRVLEVEGTVTRGTRSHHRGRTTYYYQVDGQSFGVGRAGYEALLEDIPCRVFYLPHTGELASLEPLNQAAQGADTAW